MKTTTTILRAVILSSENAAALAQYAKLIGWSATELGFQDRRIGLSGIRTYRTAEIIANSGQETANSCSATVFQKLIPPAGESLESSEGILFTGLLFTNLHSKPKVIWTYKLS